MEKILINGHPCLTGEDSDAFIDKLPYLDLDVNAQVTSIGRRHSGMETKLTFESPATYKGIFTNDDDRYLAFEIDKRDIVGRSLFNNPSFVCILIAISGNILYLQNFNDMVTKEIKPVFYNEKQ